MSDSTYFPFSAIVGQADMKEALLCNAVHPGVGGVLISGTRGTAKSTAVRSLAHLLPHVEAVAECPYNCPPDDPGGQCARCAERDLAGRPELVEEIRTPFVNLPIGATEDRVLGTIDLEAAIREGERSFEPGLLARANRGILYVDEVNLLGDHLVDVLLDAVATGTNRVEREGVSVEHPANVMLVGTMNPEEGELRPQLLDRFGLYVEMDRGMAPEDRKAVVRRRARYDADPEAMAAEWREEEAAIAERIEAARAAFPDVEVGEDALDRIVHRCVGHDVEGLRADVVVHRTARALAALDGRSAVEATHVDRAAELALGHRASTATRRDPGRPDRPGDGGSDEGSPADSSERPSPDELPAVGRPTDDEANDGDDDEAAGQVDETAAGGSDGDGAEGEGDGAETEGDSGRRGPDGGRVASADEEGSRARDGAAEERVFPVAAGAEPPRPTPDRRLELPGPTEPGRRTRAITDDRRGAYVAAGRPRGPARDVALDATIRAAAPHQAARRAGNDAGPALRLTPADVREKRRRSRVRNLVVFVVDSSGSMGARERMSAVKGAVLSLLEDAYRQRDHVSLVGFRGEGAETLLPPTASVRRAARALSDLPTGGRTPLAAGLEEALGVVERQRGTAAAPVPLLVLVSDGRSNVSRTSASPVGDAMDRAERIRAADVPAVCYDTETGPVRMGLVRKLADRMGAAYHRFDDFDADRLSASVGEELRGTRPTGSR